LPNFAFPASQGSRGRYEINRLSQSLSELTLSPREIDLQRRCERRELLAQRRGSDVFTVMSREFVESRREAAFDGREKLGGVCLEFPRALVDVSATEPGEVVCQGRDSGLVRRLDASALLLVVRLELAVLDRRHRVHP
jgi:hypothetical protein